MIRSWTWGLLATVATAGLLAGCGGSTQPGTVAAAHTNAPGVAPARVTDCTQLPGALVLPALAHTTGQHVETTLVKGVRCVWATDLFTLQVVADTPAGEAAGYTLGGSPCPGHPGSVTADYPPGSPHGTVIAECGPLGVFLAGTPSAPPITDAQERAVLAIASTLSG